LFLLLAIQGYVDKSVKVLYSDDNNHKKVISMFQLEFPAYFSANQEVMNE